MAWIESHDNLKDHPKTRRAARLLGVSVPTIIGHLHLLWHWCLSYAEDGDLSGYDAADIAEAVMWDGDPNQFIDALLNCGPAGKTGFLERDDQGRLLVHDWYDYAGRLLEKREEAREAGARGNHERWHVQRGIVDPTCPYCQEASAQDGQAIGSPSGGESGGDSQPESEPNRVLSHRTVPYQTVPYQDRQTDSATTRQMDKPEAKNVGPSVGQSIGLSVDAAEPSPDMAAIARHYGERIGMLGPSIFADLGDWHDRGMEAEVIMAAIDRTAEARSEGRIRGSPDSYLRGVLRQMYNDGIRTADDLRARGRADPRSPDYDPVAVILERAEEWERQYKEVAGGDS